MLDSSCRCLTNGSGETNRAALGNNYTVRSAALRRSDDRAKIMGVFNSVKDNDEGLLAARLCILENLLYRGIIALGGDCYDSLMARSAGNSVKLSFISFNNIDLSLGGKSDKEIYRSLALA